MKHTPLNVTDQQRANLKKLALYVWHNVPQAQFDMRDFSADGPMENHKCGTVACMVGHGPAAGISPVGFSAWNTYSFARFCLLGNQWTWMFGGAWKRADNTPKGGAQRIFYALKHGVPESWPDQMSGDAPLCYTEVSP